MRCNIKEYNTVINNTFCFIINLRGKTLKKMQNNNFKIKLRNKDMTTLKTSILGIEFENPFLLASAPPTSAICSIDKAFEMGWGGAVLKSGLLNYLETKGFNDISELKNIAIPKITSHEKLNKKSHLYPSIDNEKCVKCGKCAKICSESEYNALNLDKECLKLNKESCAGCSLCSHVCPKEAIQMC